MENKSIIRLLIVILLCVGISIAHVPLVQGDIVFKQVTGIVVDAPGPVRAYDGTQNGEVYYYIQNRTEEGSGTAPIKDNAGTSYYDPAINADITDWIIGDDCVLVVNRDFGTYGVDHAGYLAYHSVTLDDTGVQFAPPVDLLKIPTPTIGTIGSGFINIDWTPLADPTGVIAGYTVYSSPTNGTTSGDAEWTLVGGTVSAPISGSTFNDTTVSQGQDYYYSLKLVFTGYSDDTPANIDNYECMVFGEGSEMVTPPAPVLPIDYIVIEYANGTAVVDILLNVGESTVSVIAQGWSNTGPTRVIALESDWTVDLTNLGDVSPANGTATVFTAEFEGGTAQVTAEWGGMTDTFNVIIADPVIDYIVLENATGGEIQDHIMNMSLGALEIFAAGYNNTGPTFIAYQDVTWEAFPNPGNGTFDPETGTTTMFAGNKEGGVEIRGTLSPGVFDNFTLNLIWGIPPTIDDIKITDDIGNELDPFSLDILQTSQLYAWGFNLSSGDPISATSVDWTLDAGGNLDTQTGLSSLFTAGTQGVDVTVTATSGLMSDDLVITINPPTIDYIVITDVANGTELTTLIRSTVGIVDAVASGYNNTGDTYVDLVPVTWSKNDPDSLGTLSDTTGVSTTFTGADNGEGSVVITASDGGSLTDNFTVDLFDFSLDEIKITDAIDGIELTAVILNVGDTITLYASGYNISQTPPLYVGLVSVDWTIVDALGTFSVATGDTTVFTAGMDGGITSITGENTALDVTDNFQLTVTAPTVDTIEIRDAVDNGGDAITSATFTLGNVTSLKVWCAGYNTTAGYIGDESASWSLDVTTIGSIDITSGTFTTFTALAEGSGVLTADVGGVTDSITITVNAEIDDQAPEIPTGLTVTAVTDQKSLTILWDANTDDAVSYDLYRSTTATGTFEKVNTAAIIDTTYTDTGLEWETTYYYKITASDAVPNESPRSSTVSGTTSAEPDDGDGDGDGDGDEFPMVLLLLPLIIIIVLILLVLMMKKKKPAEVPPPEEKAEEPPAEEEPEPEPEEEEVPEEEETPPPEDEGEEAPPEEGDEEKPPEE